MLAVEPAFAWSELAAVIRPLTDTIADDLELRMGSRHMDSRVAGSSQLRKSARLGLMWCYLLLRARVQ